MEIREQSFGSITLLNPVGRLVLDQEPPDSTIKDALLELMTQGHRQFVVNLKDITQVDTSGLAALVAAHLAVIRRGGRMKLANPTKRLKEVLAMTKLNMFFEVCDDEQDAVRALTESQGVPGT